MIAVHWIATLLLLETATLWVVVVTMDTPHKGLVAWTLLNTLGCIITQLVVLCNAVEVAEEKRREVKAGG